MKPEDQVISLDLSKKLKELGVVDLKSLFYWIRSSNPKGEWMIGMIDGFNFIYHDEHLSAFTASELMSLLPRLIDTKKDEPFNNFRFNLSMFYAVTETESYVPIKHYSINYHCDTFTVNDLYCAPRQLFEHNIHDVNFTECCARVLIKLIEDGLMKV